MPEKLPWQEWICPINPPTFFYTTTVRKRVHCKFAMGYILHISNNGLWQATESMAFSQCTIFGDASDPYCLSQPKEIAGMHMIFCRVYLMEWPGTFLRNNFITGSLYDEAAGSIIWNIPLLTYMNHTLNVVGKIAYEIYHDIAYFPWRSLIRYMVYNSIWDFLWKFPRNAWTLWEIPWVFILVCLD